MLVAANSLDASLPAYGRVLTLHRSRQIIPMSARMPPAAVPAPPPKTEYRKSKVCDTAVSIEWKELKLLLIYERSSLDKAPGESTKRSPPSAILTCPQSLPCQRRRHRKPSSPAPRRPLPQSPTNGRTSATAGPKPARHSATRAAAGPGAADAAADRAHPPAPSPG